MTIAPFGTWESPLSAVEVASAIVGFQDVVIDGADIYWSEMRPTQGGRYVIVKSSHGKQTDVLPSQFNARTRVHEYGGAAFTVYQGIIYFTHFQDQRLYKIAPAQSPVAITPLNIRFADFTATPLGIIAIGESHLENNAEPKNFIALINPDNGEIKVLHEGYDFYAFPAIRKDYKQLAWICWNHPNMPWDDTQLWMADINQQGLSNLCRIDANVPEQAFFQPQWGPNNELVVISDKSNWWNLYRVNQQQLELLFALESDLGRPLWNLGASTWAFYKGGILCSFAQEGKEQLFHFKDGQLHAFELPFSSFSQIRVSADKVAFIGGGPAQPTAIVTLDDAGFHIIKENTTLAIDKDYLSIPEHIAFPSTDERTSYAYYYPPKNKDYSGIANTKPPLIVKSHGGPTANCGSNLNLEIQYWTSRGFAFVDVNYAGSTGYGRQYRKSLETKWGIYDIADCEAAALYLAQKGLVDKNKLAITGGSAGGFTTLAALAFTTTFQVGASLYGVSDLEALTQETHKFESRYLERLIGPYPSTQSIYQARSPIHHIDKLNAPIIFFQGDEDKIVLPNQAQMMYDALKEKGLKTALFIFEGEQHGFRKAENRITVLKEQYKFFVDVLC